MFQECLTLTRCPHTSSSLWSGTTWKWWGIINKCTGRIFLSIMDQDISQQHQNTSTNRVSKDHALKSKEHIASKIVTVPINRVKWTCHHHQALYSFLTCSKTTRAMRGIVSRSSALSHHFKPVRRSGETMTATWMILMLTKAHLDHSIYTLQTKNNHLSSLETLIVNQKTLINTTKLNRMVKLVEMARLITMLGDNATVCYISQGTTTLRAKTVRCQHLPSAECSSLQSLILVPNKPII